jgi:hypothetical protein
MGQGLTTVWGAGKLYMWKKNVKLVKLYMFRKMSGPIVSQSSVVGSVLELKLNSRKDMRCALDLNHQSMHGTTLVRPRRGFRQAIRSTVVEFHGTKGKISVATSTSLKEFLGFHYIANGEQKLKKEMGVAAYFAEAIKNSMLIIIPFLLRSYLKSTMFPSLKKQYHTKNFGIYRTVGPYVCPAIN